MSDKKNCMSLQEAYELAITEGIDKKSSNELIDFIYREIDFETSKERIMYFLLDSEE